jgi:glycosyltransferase involved in cell wall biosynthesis
MPLAGAVDELVVMDTGSTDRTREVLDEIARDLKLERYRYELLHPLSPSFITDEPDTWCRKLPGPFTGRRLPRDWAAVRNAALDETTADYVLKLDADDEPFSPPENWTKTCSMLDQKEEVDVVSCPYEICDGHGNVTWLSMYDRLWRRTSKNHAPLRWTQPCHEMLSGKTANSVIYAAGGLRVRDHRDSPGDGVRIAHRNLKVLLWNRENGDKRLYHDSGRAGVSMAQSHLVETFTLAHEAADVLPDFAHELLAGVMCRLESQGKAADLTMLADCHYHVGRCYEARGDQVGALSPPATAAIYDRAAASYRRADEIASHSQALLRLHALYLRRGMIDQARELRPLIMAKVGPGQSPYNYDLVLAAGIRAMEEVKDESCLVSSGPIKVSGDTAGVERFVTKAVRGPDGEMICAPDGEVWREC